MRHFYTLCAFYQNLQPLVLRCGHQEGAENLAFRVILDGYVLADEVVGGIAPTVLAQPCGLARTGDGQHTVLFFHKLLKDPLIAFLSGLKMVNQPQPTALQQRCGDEARSRGLKIVTLRAAFADVRVFRRTGLIDTLRRAFLRPVLQ